VEENVVVLEAGGITDFTKYIKYDPGLCIQIEEFAPNAREDVRFAYLKNGPTQPTEHNFCQIETIDPFYQNGIRNLIGWNIVWKRIRPIASIVIFLNMTGWMKNLGMMSSTKWGLTIGRM
jgi:hypothetical protein